MTPAAFIVTVERERAWLCGYCRRTLIAWEDAEDCAQETLLRAWRNAAAMPTESGACRRWLATIAKNLCIDRNRRVQVRARLYPQCVMSRVTDVEATALLHCELRAVGAAMGTLSATDRDALMLNTCMSGAEMGAVMGITAAGAKSRVFRARTHLIAAMDA